MEWYDTLSDDQRMIFDTVDRFCRETVEPYIAELERDGKYPARIVSEMAELGLFGLTIPEAYGGFGANSLTGALVARRISETSAGLYLIQTANSSLAATPIIYAGTDEQKERYLPLLASGEALGCFALTEPGTGSDVAGMKTRAVKIGDKWVLNGAKTFITNAAHARVAVIFARTGEKPHDISAFVLSTGEAPLETTGVTVRKIEKWSQRVSDMCEIFLDDVELPVNALLGEMNGGFRIAMETLNAGRINIAAQALGVAASVVDYAWEYINTRRAFGSSIAENQHPQQEFARWYSELRVLWSSVKEAAEKRDNGILAPEEAAGVKLHATESAWRIAVPAAHYIGGNLFAKEIPIMGKLMDVLITPVYEGASNIQAMVIMKSEVGKMKK